jgi:hypothetical protein
VLDDRRRKAAPATGELIHVGSLPYQVARRTRSVTMPIAASSTTRESVSAIRIARPVLR